MTQLSQPLRRGLPRVAGGPLWPPAEGPSAEPLVQAAVQGPYAAPEQPAPTTPVASSAAPVTAAPPAVAEATTTTTTTTTTIETPPGVRDILTGGTLRRGLPRVSGGDAWPPLSTQAPVSTAVHAPIAPVAQMIPEPAATTAEVPPMPSLVPTPAPAPKPSAAAVDPVQRRGRQIARRALWGTLGTIGAAGVIVLAARGITTLPGVSEFLAAYPGEYALPSFVADGFPAWARWTHFLNFFFLALIVRTGLLVRRQQTPPAFFTPRGGGKKISLNLWLHTSVDLLWMATGVVFIVLLFASGHWARIVPTSWEVFPNAASALLQYLTLEWPLEDGWVNYNSLQQLMYFTVVFIAAPLAIISGVRMSDWWPKRAERLSRAYPLEVARAIHFPVMLFFVLFVIVHVFLVLTTGALKNLGHMFAGVSEPSWVGFWWFAGSLVITATVVWAARPLIVAPLAQLFGRVSAR